jgi:hypothetical protein
MGYELDDWVLTLWRGKRFFSTPQRPDWLCSPPSLLSGGFQRLYPLGSSGRDVKPNTQLHLVPRLRMVKLYFHSPIFNYGTILIYFILY